MPLTDPIAVEAQDRLPETWEALSDAKTFGDVALERFLDRTVKRLFGTEVSTAEQEALDAIVIEYCGLYFAIKLLDPAMDFWSKQVLSQSAGERESRTYKDRVEDLKALKKDWIAELAELWLDVSPLMPVIRRRAKDTLKVSEPGTTVPTFTADPFSMEPLYGDPEDTGAATGGSTQIT